MKLTPEITRLLADFLRDPVRSEPHARVSSAVLIEGLLGLPARAHHADDFIDQLESALARSGVEFEADAGAFALEPGDPNPAYQEGYPYEDGSPCGDPNCACAAELETDEHPGFNPFDFDPRALAAYRGADYDADPAYFPQYAPLSDLIAPTEARSLELRIGPFTLRFDS